MSLLVRSARTLVASARPATRLTLARAFSSGNRDDRKYTESDEWMKVDSGVGTIGITDYAQQALGDIAFVELPEQGEKVVAGERAAALESVKASAEIIAPVDGEVVEVNDALADDPSTINSSAFDDGWLFKVKLQDEGQTDGMLSKEDYEKKLAEKS